MSTLILSKRTQSLKTLTLTIGFAACAALLGSTAYAADPEKKLDEQASQAEKIVDEMQEMEVPPPAELPANKDADDGAVEMLPEVKPEAPAEAENCFTQADGSTECICVTAETCTELMASDTCEAETAWQKDDSYGGCTQKQPE